MTQLSTLKINPIYLPVTTMIDVIQINLINHHTVHLLQWTSDVYHDNAYVDVKTIRLLLKLANKQCIKSSGLLIIVHVLSTVNKMSIFLVTSLILLPLQFFITITMHKSTARNYLYWLLIICKIFNAMEVLCSSIYLIFVKKWEMVQTAGRSLRWKCTRVHKWIKNNPLRTSTATILAVRKAGHLNIKTKIFDFEVRVLID